MSKDKVILSLIILALLARLLPHPPNFAPIAAIALFGGNKFDNKWLAFCLPLLCMVLSDLVIGFSSVSVFVYLSFMLISLIGIKSKKINNTVILSSSLLFFLVTNLGVFFLGYPHTIEGLVSCYVLAIPFFVNTLVGDFVFTYALKFSFSGVKKFGLITQ